MALLAWRCVNHEPRHTQTFVLTDAGNGGRRSEGTAQWEQNSKLVFVQDPGSEHVRTIRERPAAAVAHAMEIGILTWKAQPSPARRGSATTPPPPPPGTGPPS
jgi:hypothetical protein